MSNRTDKPMLSSSQLVAKMRDENKKGITFKYTSEEAAETYLSDVNNYAVTVTAGQKQVIPAIQHSSDGLFQLPLTF